MDGPAIIGRIWQIFAGFGSRFFVQILIHMYNNVTYTVESDPDMDPDFSESRIRIKKKFVRDLQNYPEQLKIKHFRHTGQKF